MRLVKVSEGFYTDFDKISTLLVEPVREWDEAEHHMNELLVVVGVTEAGARIPVNLFSVVVDDPKKAMLACEAFIQKFWKVN